MAKYGPLFSSAMAKDLVDASACPPIADITPRCNN